MIEPGTLVDHFSIMRFLAQGGMGEVYLARDTRARKARRLESRLAAFLGGPGPVRPVPLRGARHGRRLAGRPACSRPGAASSPVVRLVPGPMRTVVAGFHSGAFGIWSLDNGAQLHRQKLNGPVVHLVLADGRLHVASELGQVTVLDLSVFGEGYRELMRTVWDKVPIVWDDGFAVLRPPPE